MVKHFYKIFGRNESANKILKNVGFNRTEVLKHWYFVVKYQYHDILH